MRPIGRRHRRVDREPLADLGVVGDEGIHKAERGDFLRALVGEVSVEPQVINTISHSRRQDCAEHEKSREAPADARARERANAVGSSHCRRLVQCGRKLRKDS